MMVEWSETCRQNPSRTLPRKCTAIAEPRKAQTTRNCGANRRITMTKNPEKPSRPRPNSRFARQHSRRRLRLAGNLKAGSLQSVHQASVYQKPVEAAGFRAVLAGVEHSLAAQHDLLLLLERRVERDTGGFLDHQRQIGPVDRIHHRGTLDRFEADRIDRVISRVIGRVVIVQLLADPGL